MLPVTVDRPSPLPMTQVRMKESRRVKAAKKWAAEMAGGDESKVGEVLSSWGPYTSTIGQVYKKNDLALPAVSTRPFDSTKLPASAK